MILPTALPIKGSNGSRGQFMLLFSSAGLQKEEGKEHPPKPPYIAELNKSSNILAFLFIKDNGLPRRQ